MFRKHCARNFSSFLQFKIYAPLRFFPQLSVYSKVVIVQQLPSQLALSQIRSLCQSQSTTLLLKRLCLNYRSEESSRTPSTSKAHELDGGHSKLPAIDQLFYVDSLMDTLVPKFLKQRELALVFLKMCVRDVVFEDRIFKRYMEGINKFALHITMSQLYLSLLRRQCKFEKLGSCVYDGCDVLIVLWRLSSFRFYGSNAQVIEGSINIHLNADGLVYKVINRPISREDHEGAGVMEKLKTDVQQSQKTEAPRMQIQAIFRFLKHFTASSASHIITRAYCTSRNAENKDGPRMFQLEHVRRRLEITVPLMFRQQPDFTFYKSDMVYRDEFLQISIVSRSKFIFFMGLVGTLGQFFFPHIEMEALNILPILEDGTVRLRWRVKHVSLLRAILDPRMFKRDYRLTKLKWLDGYSIFHVDSEGLVYRVVTRRTIDDEQRKQSRLEDFAEKVGILPKGANAASA